MKFITTLGLVATLTCGAIAQETQVTQQTVTTEQSGSRIETRTVVTRYETYLREAYVAVGFPQDIISRLIRLDLEILEARVNLDFARVRVLINEQIRILNPTQVVQVRTYVTSHPLPVGIPIFAQPVWINNVNVVNNDVQVVINNEQEIRSVVEREKIKSEDLNIRARIEASGSVKSSQDTKAGLSEQQKAAINANDQLKGNQQKDSQNKEQIKSDADVQSELKTDPADLNRTAPENADKQKSGQEDVDQKGLMDRPLRDTAPENKSGRAIERENINKMAPGQSNQQSPNLGRDFGTIRSNSDSNADAIRSSTPDAGQKREDISNPSPGHSAQPKINADEKREQKY